MRHLLLVALAACSSGGQAGFNPSQDIEATHPHLRGEWNVYHDGQRIASMTITRNEPGAFRSWGTSGGIHAGNVYADGAHIRIVPSVGSQQFIGYLGVDDYDGTFSQDGETYERASMRKPTLFAVAYDDDGVTRYRLEERD